jgi:nicotinamidase-related amidase
MGCFRFGFHVRDLTMFRAGVLLMAGLTGFFSLNATLRHAATVGAQVILQKPAGMTGTSATDQADQPSTNFSLRARSTRLSAPDSAGRRQVARTEMPLSWNPQQTAVIVCDVWDRHHCLNAVRRMEEFLPRLEQLLSEARRRGAVIIHSPSDCMPAYADHPARRRAMAVPAAADPLADLQYWCSQIPAEELALWPIDQSDGGEDDDPAEHARWAAQLKAEGRNPGLPWKAQHPDIRIDDGLDYISDRGDEVWNILEARGIRNVILTGVHTNMCVLGRPFGLRQLVRAGKQVLLMRDLTDSMYNPQRWPYVDHFSGHDLVISHVEQFVCPTVTSDQVLGGKPHQSRYDLRSVRDIATLDRPVDPAGDFQKHWTTAAVPALWKDVSGGHREQVSGTLWLRCSIRLPSAWMGGQPVQLQVPSGVAVDAWLNGSPLTVIEGTPGRWLLPQSAVLADGINLLVLKTSVTRATRTLPDAPVLHSHSRSLKLNGRWQLRLGEDPAWSAIPLPAQFGLGPDVLFTAREN